MILDQERILKEIEGFEKKHKESQKKIDDLFEMLDAVSYWVINHKGIESDELADFVQGYHMSKIVPWF
jgi:hypothetical protein